LSDAIINKTLDLLKNDIRLSAIKEWYEINGLVPGPLSSLSIGCDEEDFEADTPSYDRVTTQLKIYVSLDNRHLAADNRKKEEHRLAYGERCIRALAAIVRHCLSVNYTLDGLADTSFIKKIDYMTADEHKDLHIAVISFEVIFYAPRREIRNEADRVVVEFLGMDIDVQRKE
jgi:hypothetical protein